MVGCLGGAGGGCLAATSGLGGGYLSTTDSEGAEFCLVDLSASIQGEGRCGCVKRECRLCRPCNVR